jgi:hypothetical protein
MDDKIKYVLHEHDFQQNEHTCKNNICKNNTCKNNIHKTIVYNAKDNANRYSIIDRFNDEYKYSHVVIFLMDNYDIRENYYKINDKYYVSKNYIYYGIDDLHKAFDVSIGLEGMCNILVVIDGIDSNEQLNNDNIQTLLMSGKNYGLSTLIYMDNTTVNISPCVRENIDNVIVCKNDDIDLTKISEYFYMNDNNGLFNIYNSVDNDIYVMLSPQI